jgi:hypothetical protein
MNEKIYIGIFKDGEQVGAFEFNNIEDVTISFVDGLHDLSYILKKISKEDYKSFSEGDELTIEEFVQAYQSHIK